MYITILVIMSNFSTPVFSKKGRRSLTKKSGQEAYTLLGISEEYWNRPGVWDEKDLASLQCANRQWAARMRAEGSFVEGENCKGHAPKILWIGCSDARVPVNEMIGEASGNVFVHRNIANQVISTDFNCMSVIQYAVDVLQVKHVVVCGHYDCGGIKAALVNVDHSSPLENWLGQIRDIHHHHFAELSAIKDLRGRQRRLVEISTMEQCLNIFKTASVQRRRIATQLQSLEARSRVSFIEPAVHAFVYEPESGELKKLDVNFEEHMQAYSNVFDLYSMSDPLPCSCQCELFQCHSEPCSLDVIDVVEQVPEPSVFDLSNTSPSKEFAQDKNAILVGYLECKKP